MVNQVSISVNRTKVATQASRKRYLVLLKEEKQSKSVGFVVVHISNMTKTVLLTKNNIYRIRVSQ